MAAREAILQGVEISQGPLSLNEISFSHIYINDVDDCTILLNMSIKIYLFVLLPLFVRTYLY